MRFAALFALVGLLVGRAVSWDAIGSGWALFPLYAVLAGFVTAFALWQRLIGARPSVRRRRALVTGALTGLLSHPLCWWLLILGANIDHLLFGTVSSLGEPPMNPLQGLVGALGYSLFSLYLVGWLTVLAGVLLAWLVWRTGASRSVVDPRKAS